MTYARSNYHLRVLLGLAIVLVGCSAAASVINGRKNDDFEANSMLRDSSGKGVLNNAEQQQHRAIVSAAAVGQDNGEDDSSSPSVLMMNDVGDGGGNGVRSGNGGGSSGISEKSSSYAVDTNTNTNTNTVRQDDDEDIILLPLNDQVRLLTKQLNALTIRRREDYELLENNLRKSLRITNNAEDMDMSIRAELDQLRHEMKALRENHIGGTKEKLTIEWISQSMAEIRKELAEVQEIAGKASKEVSQRRQNFEDLATIKSDFHLFKLELEALKDRQQTTEVFVKELREDAMQRESDFRKLLQMMNQIHGKETNAGGNPIQLSIETEADHKRRHHRFQRQQLHDLEIAQRDVKRQLNELKYHRIGERVRNLEIEQHRIAGANFNLSREIASLDKLHSSMLELLEDVEGIHNKMDKTLPDVRREISKLEFTTAQLNSEQSLVREEGQNVARSVQAMAVSVSALQEERDTIKDMQIQVDTLRKDVERLQSIAEVQKSIVHRRIEKMENEAKRKAMLALDLHGMNKVDAGTVMADGSVSVADSSPNGVEYIESAAQNLVEKLESVELQYESIINKLPNDCSQVEAASTASGLYLIAPAGQHKPTMAHCTEGWTTIQRRFDGSVDFNRSWEAYASGFGTPAAEYWIGNDMLHHLTADNCTELKIVMQDIYDNTWYAQYTNFYISPREDGYRLHIGGYSGNASDALDYQNEMQFSAIDVDRDISNTHCAANYEGGWWFSHCQHANLNGRYNLGLTWFDASRNEWIAVKSSQMLITKRQSCTVDTVDRRSNSHHSSDDKSPEYQVKATPQQSQLATNVATESTSRTDGDGNSLTIANGERVAFIKPSIAAADVNNVKLTKVRTTTTIASVV